MSRYLDGEDILWWKETAVESGVDRLKEWLQQWDTISLESDDDGGDSDDYGDDGGYGDDDDDDDRRSRSKKNGMIQNTFIVVGGEGKTSLVYHLAHSLKYEVIEVNNADQTLASVVGKLQEATQSRVMKMSNLKKRKGSALVIKKSSSHGNKSKSTRKGQEQGQERGRSAVGYD